MCLVRVAVAFHMDGPNSCAFFFFVHELHCRYLACTDDVDMQLLWCEHAARPKQPTPSSKRLARVRIGVVVAFEATSSCILIDQNAHLIDGWARA